MENFYNDEMLPENFEQIAKAYSKSLKDRGFVFVRLEEEEFNLLLDEIFVIIAKMRACLLKMDKVLNSTKLQDILEKSEKKLSKTYNCNKTYKFLCLDEANRAFLGLVSLENLLLLKLMLLAVKSERLEECNEISTSIASIFAESFPSNFKII